MSLNTNQNRIGPDPAEGGKPIQVGSTPVAPHFYRASAVAASPVLATIEMSVRPSVCPSVRPSVCPSHADIV